MMLSLFFILLVGCTAAEEGQKIPKEKSSQAISIRIGWQKTWATQGQLAVILQESKILEELGLEGKFVGFQYGKDLNQGAISGKVDVLFTADQPAIALCNLKKEWGVIGRLMYNRVGTFVPPESPVQSPKDLAGKIIGIPKGAAAERETLAALKNEGVDPLTEVTIKHMEIAQIGAVVMAGAKDGRWNGPIDAGSAWDPLFADLESKKKIRPIAKGVVTSVVVMNDTFLEQYPYAAQKMMKAMKQAYSQYKKDPQQANTRFIKASNLKFSSEALELAASVEPNLLPQNPIRVRLNKKDQENIQKAADFMFSAKKLKQKVDTSTMIRPIAIEK